MSYFSDKFRSEEEGKNAPALSVLSALFPKEVVTAGLFVPEELHKLTGGNLDLAGELTDLFAKQAKQYVDGLKNQPKSDKIIFNLHALKGVSRCVGALKLARAAEEAEKTGRESKNPQSVSLSEVIAIAEDTLIAAHAFNTAFAARDRASE